MILTAALLATVLSTAVLPTAPDVVQLQRHPKLPGVADAAIWQRVHFTSPIASKPATPMFSSARSVTQNALQQHDVFIRAHDDHGMALARSMGVRLQGDRWMPVQMDMAQIRAALALAGGLELRTAPSHRPLLDRSVLEVGADLVHHGVGRMPARTGKGVLLGVIDTGIDLHHPAFHRADGTSRIVATWDQDSPQGPAPAGFNYGSYCSQDAISARRCLFYDSLGHGTHVSGIAAGSSQPSGIASDADIAVVRSDRFTRMGDALLFLIQLAEQRKQPLVVNVSVGGQYGPHDGRTPLEQYISYLTTPGRLLVAAAGNDGADAVHVGAQLQAGVPKRVALGGLGTGAGSDCVVEIWTQPGVSLALTFEVWNGQAVQVTVPLSAGRSDLLHGMISMNGLRVGEATYGVDYVSEHAAIRHTILFDRSNGDPLPKDAILAVKLDGVGEIHGWISQSDYSNGRARFGAGFGAGWLDGDSALSITVPATAHNVIAVGSYVTRTDWHSEWMGDQSLGFGVFGDRAPYSSLGPTLLPLITGVKPNISAPGTVIVSARAVTVPAGPDTVSDQQMAMQGTSMSAPHVAGVVALMLEADPELSPTKAAAILQATGRQDAFTGVIPNDAWGYGKLDAYAAVSLTEKGSGGCAASPLPMEGAWHIWIISVLMVCWRCRRPHERKC